MSLLFSPYQSRSVHIRNRIGVAPMCQYSCVDGLVDDWHLVHLGSRAAGGAGLVMAEASAVAPQARISLADAGIWSPAHAQAFAPVTAFVKRAGAVAGIQLAHAGRKGSTLTPWVGRRALTPQEGGWTVHAPSTKPYDDAYAKPEAMDPAQIDAAVAQFAAAALHSVDAGFEVLEIHAGHGYLLHQFLSPLTNGRTDRYGGSLDNRMRLLLRVVDAVRAGVPDGIALWVRLSATDWLDGGWTLDDSVQAARLLRSHGVDLIDCSSGALTPAARPAGTPGFQVPLAATLRERAGIATAAVGLITEARQAEAILAAGHADMVLMARALLRDPYWPLRAAQELDGSIGAWPLPYRRAVNPG